MHRTYLLLIFISSTLFSQKKIEKQIPTGFQLVKERKLLVSFNEVTIKQWYDFMSSRPDHGINFLPEPNDLVGKCLCNQKNGAVNWIDPTKTNYRDTAYFELKEGKPGKKRRAVEPCSEMPITGISYEMALSYCQYLNDKIKKDSPDLPLTFRLPTPGEMDNLLLDTFSDWEPSMDNYKTYQNGVNTHGCAIYNHRHESWCENNINMKHQYGYGVPMVVSYFFPDVNGLFDLMGNVAEMTSVKGIAKGGSCIHDATDCQPGAENKYDQPQFWLGFRVVADFSP